MTALLFIVGLLAGFIGTIIGAGGGFLIIPFLLIAAHFPPARAVATSLSVVFLNTLSGSWVYARKKRIDYPTAISFAVATIPGSIAGAYLTRYFSGPGYRTFFGVFLLCVAA
ncbi:MAG TPA: sulfite exporter TauE/SafE family protein, partial [Bacillota bacterium]|nr:sulfite exporter TauE/SafE family protein [Bacillota bacterium]